MKQAVTSLISGISLSKLVEGKLSQYLEALGGDLGGELYDRVMKEVERPLIDLALQVCRGNKVRTAALLGISRNTLKRKMGELGLA
ncbi:MAG: porin [Candidatus Puniceispirillum sp.]|nr:porin [Candidatus Puniceispirillum sp.]MCA0370625.1 porin [Pseudomonadota bacterium]